MSGLPEKYIHLSKHLSYILRHHPEKAGLELDERGYTDLDELLRSLKDTRYSWVKKEDIEQLIGNSVKQRFEIKDDRIRALYGHSIDVEIENPVKPPEILYHGTSPRSMNSILKEGLKPMNRQYVHLSRSRKEAYKVGKRHDEDPVILKIEAGKAWSDGIKFYERPDVILANRIPSRYIEVYRR